MTRNEERHCLWCGKKLKFATVATFKKVETETGFHHERTGKRNVYTKPGAYGDGYFCTLRCGHHFGVVAARRGARMRPGDSLAPDIQPLLGKGDT